MVPFCKKMFVLVVLLSLLFAYNLNSKDVEFPLVQSFAYYPYEENHLLLKGQSDMGINIYHSNIFTFNKGDNIMNDFELTSITVGGRYGLFKGLTLEAFVRYMAVSGGFMDGFIENFHKFFGLPDAYRPDYPRDIVNYYKKDYFLYENKTGNMSPIVISLLAEIIKKDNFALNARVGIGLPLISKPGLSSDKPFLTAGLIFVYELDRLSIVFSNYLSWYKAPEWFEDVDLKSRTVFSEIRVTYKRFLTGFIFKTSPLIETESGYNAYQIQLGFIINDNLEFLFLEDFAPFDTTPDISLNLRIKL